MSELNAIQTQLIFDDQAALKSEPDQASGWYEAMAQAWGEALNKQASSLIDKADQIANGEQSPEAITLLTAESLRMQFLSNSSHTALTSMGAAMETMARKQ